MDIPTELYEGQELTMNVPDFQIVNKRANTQGLKARVNKMEDTSEGRMVHFVLVPYSKEEHEKLVRRDTSS